ncbi:hypothetical protein HU200_006226 [Digitaria exilis]|uniref:RNase H type-1 domain-containing protein n=1 Tax=Digitaria exilis TaxID=1010633 RepID=A0A835FR82_9POAL|nr:hypothetical protein HU200_006226 [Digitaria exilis]
MVEDLICINIEGDNKLVRDRTKWQKPETGWWKVNTDAAFSAGSSIGAGGAIIRDAGGCLLAAAAKRYEHVHDTLTAEAMAARDGLQLAAENGYERVTLEIDCLPLFNLLQSDMGVRSSIAGLWHEIRELGKGFSFKLSFVYRDGNEAAHAYARLVSESSPVVSWLNSFSLCLLRVTEKDCNPGSYD